MANNTGTSNEWLTEIVDGVRSLQVASRDMLGQMQAAKNDYHVLEQYEAPRLRAARGEDDPAVIRLDERLQTYPAQVQEMDLAGELERITVPKTNESDMLVQGRVTDERLHGVEGLAVALTDKDGNRLDVGDVEADASGYFAFVLDKDKIKAVADLKKDVYLTVLDDKGNVRYRRPSALSLKEGTKLTEDVVLAPAVAAAGTAEAKDSKTPRTVGAQKRPAKKGR